MIFVLTPGEMRAADAESVAAVGDVALMRRAGEAIARELGTGRVVAFAGPGNNGGDAFAACAEIAERTGTFDGIIYADPAERPSQARADAQRRAKAAGIECRLLPKNLKDTLAALAGASVVLDGLFGTGARLPLPEPYATIVRAINESGIPVLAIDIPSGIDALTGAVSDPAINAQRTITLAALKPGLLLDPAAAHAGEIDVADIGIAPEILGRHQRTFAALDDAAFYKLLPQRARTADKRSAGAPLIVAGSQQFPGAAVLCARGAARAGAGYVTVATTAKAAPPVRAHLIEQVVTEIADDVSVEDAIGALLDTASHCSAIGIGPGLGLDDRTGEIVRGFLRQTQLPFVADASALFHFAKHLEIIDTPRAVITPHAGEFARLSGKGTVADAERVTRLREFVDRTHCTTLLKGATTLIYDGTLVHMNTTGISALATAGTGDVLTGIIATLLAQGLTPVDAARAGAYWHGLAARKCAQVRGRGVIAGDLPEMLGCAVDFR